jgi:hypothetical protein
VHSEALQLSGSELTRKAQVGGAQYIELCEHIEKRRPAIAQFCDPEILIVGDDGRTILRHDHADADADDHVAVRKVMCDFDHRPFAGRLRHANRGVVQAVEERAKGGR